MLTSENYFNQDNQIKYLGSTQYKDFAGCLGMKGCEAQALAKIKGEWIEKQSTAMLVGSYVDAHFEGTLDIFKGKNPDLFTQKGELKADYKKAEYIIQRLERDPYFMQYMSGKKQVIMEAEFFGVKWKIKIDSYHEGKAIVDLKVMQSLSKANWTKDFGHVSFVEYWGYDIQGAIYQKVVELNTGNKLPFYIAGASKENEPDLGIIQIDQRTLDNALDVIEQNVPRIMQLKNGEIEPDRCEQCDYCRFTKVLTEPIHYSDLVMQF